MTEKVFNSGNKVLLIREYEKIEPPDLMIESQDDYSYSYFEFNNKEQIKEIIDYLKVVYERWE